MTHRINQTNLVAPSTIAMSVVSLLAVIGPRDLEGLWGALVAVNYEIDRGPLLDALEQSIARLLVSRNGDVFSSTLPQGWVVRERAPEHEDPTGWAGWIAHSPDGRKRPLTDLHMELA